LAPASAEPVRLVIWDLDETFWHGTLTEGGIDYQQRHHDIVIELARRGILSSICSKNDPAPVRERLAEAGLWDYFVFPSIDWQPKGHRIQEIIAAAQLRPASVLFIDDNPSNLQEARHLLPDLQIADPGIIPTMLENPLFQGSDDRGLTRLAQYRLLERRQTAMQEAAGDNIAFLRASNIRIAVDHAVEDQLDRVIELVNRTNQLNFTKIRLPEDFEAARAELRTMLTGWRVQLGLVRVVDKYGDYGFCGFYAFDTLMNRMLHFCFSCRILGMGVEQFLHAKLGRPALKIQGKVLSDLASPAVVDWISQLAPNEILSGGRSEDRLGAVYLRGGCDLTAVAHYLRLAAREVVGDYNIMGAGLNLRIDHSVFLRHAVAGLTPAQSDALASVGYAPEHVASKFTKVAAKTDLFIFSLLADASHALYRHKATGVEVPIFLFGKNMSFRRTDITGLDQEALFELKKVMGNCAILPALCADFEFAGPITRTAFLENVDFAMQVIGPHKPVILTTAWEGRLKGYIDQNVELNGWLREVATAHPNVMLLDIYDCIRAREEVRDPAHFSRMVYLRLAETIIELAAARAPRRLPV
jgi:FkbH-like protein